MFKTSKTISSVSSCWPLHGQMQTSQCSLFFFSFESALLDFVYFLKKGNWIFVWMSLIMRNVRQTQVEGHSKDTRPVLFQSAQFVKQKGRLRTNMWKGTTIKAWWLNTTSWLILQQKKARSGKKWWNLNKG